MRRSTAAAAVSFLVLAAGLAGCGSQVTTPPGSGAPTAQPQASSGGPDNAATAAPGARGLGCAGFARRDPHAGAARADPGPDPAGVHARGRGHGAADHRRRRRRGGHDRHRDGGDPRPGGRRPGRRHVAHPAPLRGTGRRQARADPGHLRRHRGRRPDRDRGDRVRAQGQGVEERDDREARRRRDRRLRRRDVARRYRRPDAAVGVRGRLLGLHDRRGGCRCSRQGVHRPGEGPGEAGRLDDQGHRKRDPEGRRLDVRLRPRPVRLRRRRGHGRHLPGPCPDRPEGQVQGPGVDRESPRHDHRDRARRQAHVLHDGFARSPTS